MITYGEQNIFDLDVECIVNTVNCQVHKLYDRQANNPSKFPTAQKGLAAAFEKEFPCSQEPLIRVCKKGLMIPGAVQMIKVNRATKEKDDNGDLTIAHVATKDYWGAPSQLEWVRIGLIKLAYMIKDRGIKSVAIPPMGAGLGGLPWEAVQREIFEVLSPLAETGVTIRVLREDALGLEGQRTQPFSYAGIGARALWDSKSKIPAPILNKDGTWTTHSDAQRRLAELGAYLASRNGTLRSGAAVGADSAFEFGCDTHFGEKEIYLPADGHEGRKEGQRGVITNITDEHLKLAEKYHPRWERLGRFPRLLMARNASQCLGRDLNDPSDIIVCYTPSGGEQGGTGQSMRMGSDLGIPVLNVNAAPWKSMSTEELGEIITKVARKEITLDAATSTPVSGDGQLGLNF